MHAITSLCARCLHARHRGCNLSSPTNNPKNQNFEKMKKTPGDTIILHLCTTNDDHIMYGSWDMERERQIFLSCWTCFWPFTPAPPLPKILKKNEKNASKYRHYTQAYHKWQSHDVQFLRYEAWQSFLSFWDIICPFTPITTRKIKILKKWKKTPRGIIILHMRTKIRITWYTVPKIWCTTDAKGDILRWAPHIKIEDVSNNVFRFLMLVYQFKHPNWVPKLNKNWCKETLAM